MNVLLDTHILFWWLTDDDRLTPRHKTSILDDATNRYVSAVTGWEISIKVKLGKWPEASVLLPDLSTKIKAAGFALLPLTLAQAERAGSLDLVHRDPFDRMLVAQAIDLDLHLVTVDLALEKLGCRII